MSKNNSQTKNELASKTVKRNVNKVKKRKTGIKKKINRPLNKTPNKQKSNVSQKYIEPSGNFSITILSSTNKEKYFNNIFENYQRQKYEKKELIIILNKNSLNFKKYKRESDKYANVRVFQVDENFDLSDCINFGVEKSSCDLIAKFDDDDYYGPNYLSEAIYAIENSNAGVVGKSKFYAYFEDGRKICIRKNGVENGYTGYIHGPTLVIKRDVFNMFKFKNMSHGADQRFLKDCKKNNIKIFSTSRRNFVYFRHESLEYHTWKINNLHYVKNFRVIKTTNDYISYSNE